MNSYRYTKELLAPAVRDSLSGAGVLRILGLRQAGGTHAHVMHKIREYDLDTSHWTGQRWNVGMPDPKRKSAEEILINRPEGERKTNIRQLRRALKEIGRPYLCAECSNDGNWNGKTLVLEIDHEDGNWLNNTPDNIRYLCPNCHSQQKNSSMPHKFRSVTLEE